MRTPEEFAAMLDRCAHTAEGMGERLTDTYRVADLIRERDAEVRADERAKVLQLARWLDDNAPEHAGIDVSRILAAIQAANGFEWEHATRHRPVRVPCDCDNPTHAVLAGDDSPPTHASLEAVPSRRLVGPWEVIPDVPEA